MKKLTRLFLNTALVSTLFLGYSLVRAQDQAAPADNASGDKMEMKGDHGDGKDRMDRMKEKLGLSDSQAAKLKEAFKKQMEANKPLRDQEKIDVDTLQQKVDSKASDSDIKDLLEKLKADRKQIQDAQERSMEKIKTILTPTQQAKWVLMMGHGAAGRGKWEGKRGDWKKNHDGQDGGDSAKSAPADASTPADAQ
jgi:Spy/CpxP family protein refolding chaperone